MKIVLIRERFNPYGGAELRSAELVRLILAEGHSVTILSREWPLEPPDRPARNGVGPTPDNFSIVNLGSNPFFRSAKFRSFCLEASAWLDGPGKDRDVALSLERVPGTDVFRAGDGCHAAWLAERSRYTSFAKKLSFKVNPLHRTHLFLERSMLFHENLKLIVANSRMVKNDLLRFYDLDPGLIKVVPAGVNRASILVPDPIKEAASVRQELSVGNSPLILFIGSGFRRKGLAYALEATATMKHKSAVLLAAGKGNLKPYLRLARSLGIFDRTRLLGPRSDVAGLLAAADVFILPTIYDPAAAACLEALTAGIPVVTTKANGSSEFIEEGRTGFVLDRADNISGLADALDSALELKRMEYGQTGIPTMDDHASGILSLIADKRLHNS